MSKVLSREFTEKERKEIQAYIKEHTPGVHPITYGWLHEIASHFEEKFEMDIPDNAIAQMTVSMSARGEL